MTNKIKELDLSLTNNEFYINEENYSHEMKEVAEKFLMEHMEDGYLETEENINIYYRKYILENAKASVVMSHGLIEFSDKYAEVIYYFLKEGYSVFIMDHRGHGRSTREVNDSSLIYINDFNDYVSDFNKFMNEVVKKESKGRKCFLFAHSMGGGIGARYIEKYNKDFDAVVFSSPMFKIRTGYNDFLTNMIVKIAMHYKKGKGYLFGYKPFKNIKNADLYPVTSEKRLDYFFEKIQNNKEYQTSGACFKWLEACLKGCKEIFLEDNLKKIKDLPIIIFDVKNDSLVMPEEHVRFVNEVNNSELYVVKDDKHELISMRNEKLIPFFNTIFDFLREQL